MGKDKEYFAEDISYFYRNPLLLQMHHQEIRLRATVEAIRDSHIRQLEAMEQHRKFIEDFYSNGDFQRSLESSFIGNTPNFLKGSRSAIDSYLQGLGVEVKID